MRSLSAILICFFLCGCFGSSGGQIYSTENIARAVEELALKDYNLDLRAKLVGSTLWLYMPVTDLFIKAPKPEKYQEKFQIIKNTGAFSGNKFLGAYHVKPIPPKEKLQDYKINKEISDKIGTSWKLIRRVLFNMDKSQRDDIKFVITAVGDIKNGFEVKQTFYTRDLKKVSYGLMSIWEFQHRVVQDSGLSPLVIGDKTGKHLEYYDLTLDEFAVQQIEYRVSLKFQKPEVEQNVDINKEIAKIVSETLQMYELEHIDSVQFQNLETNSTVNITSEDIWGNKK